VTREALRGRPGVALAIVLVLAAGLRAIEAASPDKRHQSSDEYSYVAIAKALAHDHHYTTTQAALRWPPGAPVAFAAAEAIGGGPSLATGHPDITLAYWVQALAGVLLVAAVFAVTTMLAGTWAGVVAAGVCAVYPPLVTATAELLSEPLGTAMLAIAIAATLTALRGTALRRYAIAGVALGLTALARSDFLLLGLPLAALVLLARRGSDGMRSALRCAAVLLAAVALTVLPWEIYVSARAHQLVAITTGDAPELFIGTYLPGDGTSFGMRRVLSREGERTAGAVLDRVAAKRPDLGRSAALRREALDNIWYDVRHPIAYAAMTARKVSRMWLQPSRVGSPSAPGWVGFVHILVLVLALAGLVVGFARARRWPLVVLAVPIAYSTLLHAFLVSQPRYNLPLMPLLIAGGVAGVALALGLRRAPAPTRGSGAASPSS